MKNLTLLAGILCLMGCAHAHLEEWKNDELTLCGTQYASEPDLFKKAKNYCEGDITLIGKKIQANGSMYVLAGVSTNTYQHCATYRCAGKVKAQ